MPDLTERPLGRASSPEPETAPGGRRTACQLVHAVPGRLRLRVPTIASDPACAERLAGLLESDPDVTGVRLNPAAGSLVVRCQTATPIDELQDRIDEEVRAARGRVLPGRRPGAQQSLDGSGWRRLALPALTAGLAILGGPLGLAVPAPLIVGTVAAASLPIARRAVHSLRVERRLNIDVLDMTAITLTTLRGSFLAPATMITLVEVGEAIRERTARASEREMLDLLGSMAESVWRERAGGREQVPMEDVARGDTVVVYPGDRVPVDGRILDGHGLIDEHQLTGESMPVVREEGQTVYASTLVREGHLHIGVEQVGDETRAGRLIRLMQDAPVHDTRVENYAAKVADRIVVPSFVLSAALLVLTRDPARAASVLIADFVTGIRVSVPTTILAALTGAARRGIVIRSGRALEKLAEVDTVVFDKTGTVTQGQPTITGCEAIDEGMDAAEVLALAATAEQRLTHPVAEAVVRYASGRGIAPRRRRGWHYEIGLGVEASIDGRTVLVGSDRFLEREGVELERWRERQGEPGESCVYVASDGRLRGVMPYGDPVRPESPEVIASLAREQAMEVHLLTGDKRRTAVAVAVALGIDTANTHAELFPEEKAEVVRQLRAEGRTVAFVGDGVNDLPALVYSDVSVSFGGASDVARETADVVLMDDDLRGLPEALALARGALGIVRQNIRLVVAANLGAVAMTASGALGPVSAAVIHNGSTIASGANGLRPLRTDGRVRVRPTRASGRARGTAAEIQR